MRRTVILLLVLITTIQYFNVVHCDIDPLEDVKNEEKIAGKNLQYTNHEHDSQITLSVDEKLKLESLHDTEDHGSQLLVAAKPETSPVGKPMQKCVPMLNLPFNFYGSASTRQTIGTETSLSFAIGDIDMPVTPSDGSINSAIKLLSTFGKQFDLESSAEQEPIENVVKFKENSLHIQGLNLTMLNVHLYTDSDSNFGIGMTIKNTTMTGQFSYDGPLILTDSKLTGYYRMSIDNIYLVASSNLTKQQSNLEKLDKRNQFNLRTNDFKMNVSNLGYISIDIFDSKDSNKPTSNYLLRMLQRVLQKTIKRTYYTFENHIRNTLEIESRRTLDCELTRFSSLLDNSSASNHQSDLARIISGEIVRSQLSLVPLPDFEYQQSILGAGAKIQFYDGSLGGLDNVKLNGETRIKLQDEYLFINTSIGWSDLKPYYNWNLFIGTGKTPISKGFVSFNIKGIDFDAVITKGLKPDTRILVDQLIIKRLDSPKMDISGLPGMNRVTRGMVNFFMGRLKQRLSSSIQPVLKQQLEKSLNKMNMFF